MVDLTDPVRAEDAGWKTLMVYGALVVAIVAFFWAINGLDVRRSDHPVLWTARSVLLGLMMVALCVCAVVAVCDRLRQSAPESEQEISLEAFTNSKMGLGRVLLWNLFFSFFTAQMLLFFLADFLTLVDRQAWLRVLAAAPFLLFTAYAPFSRYPALIREWRMREASGE